MPHRSKYKRGRLAGCLLAPIDARRSVRSDCLDNRRFVYTSVYDDGMIDVIAGFDWDDGNRAKCQMHGISIDQIGELFVRRHATRVDVEHSLVEQRFKAIGKTDAGRFVFLVFTLRERSGKTYIRPISARYMHRKEIAHYEKENPDL